MKEFDKDRRLEADFSITGLQFLIYSPVCFEK